MVMKENNRVIVNTAFITLMNNKVVNYNVTLEERNIIVNQLLDKESGFVVFGGALVNKNIIMTVEFVNPMPLNKGENNNGTA